MMKKTMFLFVAVLTMALLVSGAWASEIDIMPAATAPAFDSDVVGTTSGAVTVDVKWMSQYLDAVNLNDSSTWPAGAGGLERAIGYYSTVALQTNSTLLFTITNGAIAEDNSLFLMAYDTTATAWVKVGVLNDVVSTDGHGNYTAVRMQISAIAGTETFADKDGLALAAGGANVLPAGAVMVLSKDEADPPVGLGIAVNQGLAVGATVRVAVTEARDDNGNPLNSPLAGSENLIQITESTLSASIKHAESSSNVSGPATSTIDASQGRIKFVDEGAGEDTPSDVTSQAFLRLDYSSAAEYGLDLANDPYTVTIRRTDMTGVTGITYGGTAMTAGVGQYSITTDLTTSPAFTADQELMITVDGTSVLAVGDWAVDVSIDPDQDANEPSNLAPITVATGLTSHSWDLAGGFQAYYPYFNSRTAYGSYIVLYNKGSVEGDVYFDVVSSSDAAVRGDLASYSNKQVPGKEVLLAGESQVYDMGELVTALGLDGNDLAHFNALRIVVTAPAQDINGTAFMADPANGGKRTMPLLTDYDTAVYQW